MKLENILLALSLSVCAAAQPPRIDIPFEKFVLDNGLTVIVHEDRKAPIVAVNMWYHVGSKNEKPGKTGFAHLYEHLMFGGSENAKGSYIKAMEKIGATDLNGTTNSDRTNFFEDVPTNALDVALFMESDRMGHFINAFDKSTLDLQRGVVQNEKRQGDNEPYGGAWELIPASTYPARHPYSWPVIGSMDDLNAASLEDVKDWFRTYYSPSNAVIVLAGDIDAKTAREKVTKYFGDIPAGPPVDRQQAWPAKMTGVHRQQIQDRVPQARVLKIWNVPGFGTADADYLDLLSDVLTKGKVSRLYQRLVYNDQLATSVYSFVEINEIGSQFYIDATARPGQDLAKVEKAIDEEIARLLSTGPTDSELKRVQTQYAANLMRGMQRIGGFGGKSDLLAQAEVFTGDPSYRFKTSFNRHEQATPAEVKKSGDEWLADGEFVLEVLPFPEHKTVASSVDRSKLPTVSGIPELKLPKLERATLANGMKIILAQRHDAPMVNFWLLEDAGYAADSTAAPGTARMTSEMLPFGTKNHSALEIDEQVETLGARLDSFANIDLSTVELSALKSNLDASIALFADVIMNPVFPQADFARLQHQRLAAIQQEKVTPFLMGLRVLPPLLFGPGHAYGVPYTGTGTEASVSEMKPADLARFHEAWYRPNNATLVVVGDTTLAEIQPAISRAFANWAQGKPPVKNIATVSLPHTPQIYLIDRPGSEQSFILTGLIAPPKASSSDVPLQVMNVILGNFGGRLNMNLREDKHYSYGAGSVLLGARAQRPFIAYAPVQTDKTKESLAEMAKEFQGMAGSRPIMTNELADAQANQTLTLPGERETMGQLGNSVTNLIQYGLPDDYYQSFVTKVMALRQADVEDAAKSLIQPEQMVWVIVGDRAKIEGGIRELKLGDLRILDADGRKYTEPPR